MRVFSLTHPEYETDHVQRARNPAYFESPYKIPSVICPRCGQWGGCDSVAEAWTPPIPDEFRKGQALELRSWKSMVPRWSALLQVDMRLIQPGARVGPPHGKILPHRGPLLPVLHPFPGRVWVSEAVAEGLVRAGLSRSMLAPVTFQKVAEPYWELVATESMWRVGVTPEAIVVCSECGRTRFPKVPMVVDSDRCSQSLIAHLDENPNYLLVREELTAALRDVANVRLEELDVK
jgi:hypothetical protein